MIQTQENGEKPYFGPDLGLLGQNSGRHFFFLSKIWLRQSLYIIVSYYHVQYQKKPMTQPWENFVTDRQTDESDFMGRRPINVGRPKRRLKNHIQTNHSLHE